MISGPSPHDQADQNRDGRVIGAVDIIIVNWNSGPWLRNCLESIARFDEGVNQVIVVDNGSVDGSAEAEAPALRHRLVRTGANLGFGKACNLGAKSATAPYLLFLNPDAALLEGALPKAVALMDSEAGARTGICGVQLVGDDGATQHHTANFPTPGTIFTHEQRQTRFDHVHSRKVDHVIGAFYLIRRSLFEMLGGFDERFFVYLEDVDLSRRAHVAGWESYYLAEAKAFHKGGGTSEQVKAQRLFYALRSRILYAFKHFSRVQAWRRRCWCCSCWSGSRSRWSSDRRCCSASLGLDCTAGSSRSTSFER